jgi:hypothetical protein
VSKARLIEAIGLPVDGTLRDKPSCTLLWGMGRDYSYKTTDDKTTDDKTTDLIFEPVRSVSFPQEGRGAILAGNDEARMTKEAQRLK